MKISVIGPAMNESQFIGYSILSVLPYVHELIYACAASSDGTDELLDYIKEKYAGEKLKILRKPEYSFDPHDMKAYNQAFNDCVDKATGDAVWFLHPDMIVTNPEKIAEVKPGPLAWWTNLTSYAGFDKVITKGRAGKWKNIHAKKFGLHYFGGYGSVNEDFYHKAITGNAYDFHAQNFKAYPFQVSDSGINVNHYCECKPYSRRLGKMKNCLKTLFPHMSESAILEAATNHPRVTLEGSGKDMWGEFEFTPTDVPPPPVFEKYRAEFNSILGRKLTSV